MGGLQVDDNLIGITGGTDGTAIGNVSDRLKIQNLPAEYAPHLTTTGTLTALNSTVGTSSLNGMGTIGVIITGTWVGTISFQGSVDGTNYTAVQGAVLGGLGIVSSTSSNLSFRANATGLKTFQVKMTSYTSGTASITIQATNGAGFVATSISGVTSGTSASWSSKLRQIDMNAGTGGVARATSITNATWVDIFNYSGSGKLAAFLVALETGDSWRIRLLIDGEEILQDSGGILLDDITGDALYDMDNSGKNMNEIFEGVGIFFGSHDIFRWNGPLGIPIAYSSSVVVKLKRETGAASKRFRAGFAVLTKES